MNHCPECGRFMSSYEEKQIGVAENYCVEYSGVCNVHGEQSVRMP